MHLAIANRLRVSNTHKVTTVNFQQGGVFTEGQEAWVIGGGGHYRKHEFQGGIVFHGQQNWWRRGGAARLRRRRCKHTFHGG